MTAEIIALTEELRAVQLLLGQVLERLDESDRQSKALRKAIAWHKFQNVVLAIAVVLLTVLSVDAYYARGRICDTVRSGQMKLVENLIAQAGPNPDAATQQQINDFRADMLADLADCG